MNKNALADVLVNKILWWRYSSEAKGELLLSSAFVTLFDTQIIQFDDMMGCYRTPVIEIKIKEVLNNPDSDVRFVVSYDTHQGKMSFQHQLHVYTESGKRYVLANCMDVTEMVALEREIVDAQGRLSVEQLVQSQRQLEEQNRIISESYQKQSRFLALLSHELRSPLLGISSLVQRLRVNETDKEVLSALKAIHITAEQSTFLVNDILTYSQTEYDEITLHPMEFSLKETLHNVKQLTRSIAADKGLIVSLVYLGQQDLVVGDSVRLSQVLINLIVNSIKFTQYGGVTIEVAQAEKNRFLFKITDSGEGIAETQLERIFEPYAQLESIGSTQSIGSGLGLLVVQKLISLMGGEISVQSILGVGTTFSFDLLFGASTEGSAKLAKTKSPILESTTLEAAATKSSVEHANRPTDVAKISSESPLILIADDSKINLMVLGGYLQELNCLVVEAKDGREAWELFQKNTFDYVFLDIQMPFLDGIEVSHKIKACVVEGCVAAKNLKKVFAVTAGGDESNFTLEGEPVGSNGFDHWFVKPVIKEQIIAALQKEEVEGGKKNLDANGDTEIMLEDVKQSQNDVGAEKSTEDRKIVDGSWEGFEDVPESFQALIHSFLLDFKKDVKELACFIEEGNTLEITKKAHYLKGNCMLLQLNGMVSVLREIEKMAQKNEQLIGNKQKKVQVMLEKLLFGLKYLENSITIRHNA
ncbi:hypothetical protein MNBD_GAMMA04-1992 [hydrothermal vent metagenome]|uniref:histidine kinase n=1 Tax=hydrothermal vent metagenome TaxID=652676 RepID=A0A3B0VUW6_9ZZZZ